VLEKLPTGVWALGLVIDDDNDVIYAAGSGAAGQHVVLVR
jgi:hypothetical protein